MRAPPAKKFSVFTSRAATEPVEDELEPRPRPPEGARNYVLGPARPVQHAHQRLHHGVFGAEERAAGGRDPRDLRPALGQAKMKSGS